MCVQDIDAQCVLQFTLVHAAGCALHRLASRVIHRLELYHFSLGGRSSKRATTTIDGNLDETGPWLRSDSIDSTTKTKTIVSGRPHDERRLFKPSHAGFWYRHAHLDNVRAIETGTPTLQPVFTDTGRLAANGFHANRRPSITTLTDCTFRCFVSVSPTQLAHRGYTFGNDPSAGSPTETLLRLLLPLDDQV